MKKWVLLFLSNKVGTFLSFPLQTPFNLAHPRTGNLKLWNLICLTNVYVTLLTAVRSKIGFLRKQQNDPQRTKMTDVKTQMRTKRKKKRGINQHHQRTGQRAMSSHLFETSIVWQPFGSKDGEPHSRG